MANAVRSYRIVIILISIAVILTAIWVFFNRNADRTPERGVFVLGNCTTASEYLYVNCRE